MTKCKRSNILARKFLNAYLKVNVSEKSAKEAISRPEYLCRRDGLHDPVVDGARKWVADQTGMWAEHYLDENGRKEAKDWGRKIRRTETKAQGANIKQQCNELRRHGHLCAEMF